METRARYLLIGSFVLVVVAAAFGFAIWLAQLDGSRETRNYQIYFSGSVAGLGVGGDVRYRGIRIGKVEEVSIVADDPSRVSVMVEIDGNVIIREGDLAVLELQGITGVSFINIEGAEPGQPEITAEPGERWPTIPSRPSAIEALFEGAPDLISQGIVATRNVSDLFGTENRELIHQILVDVRRLTNTLAAREEQIGLVLETIYESSADFGEASRAVEQTAAELSQLATQASGSLTNIESALGSAERLIEEDVRQLIADARLTIQGLNGTAVEAEALLAENREPIKAFSESGLYELSKFVIEARLLVAQLGRISERLENEGLGFLLKAPGSEFEAREK